MDEAEFGLRAGIDPVGFPWAVSLGFVRLLSSPKVVAAPRSPEELQRIIRHILNQPRVRPVVPGSRHVPIMQELFETIGGSSRMVTDVHLAALAIEHGAILASNDGDFTRFPRLKVENPLR